MKNDICYVGGLSGAGKTTLSKKLQKNGNCIHINFDEETHKLAQDNEKLIKYIFRHMPEEMKNEIYSKSPEDATKLFIDLGKHGVLDNIIHRITAEITFHKAQQYLKNNNVIIDGLLINKASRKVVLDLWKQKGILPVFIEIQGNINEILLVAGAREKGDIKHEYGSYCTKEELVNKQIKIKEDYSENEGWKRHIILLRDKINKNVEDIPELQFLF